MIMNAELTATFRFVLGQEVKDNIASFAGLVTARCEYMTGCRQYLVSSQKLDKNGEIRSGVWLDEDRLVATSAGQKLKIARKDSGGPQADAPTGRY
jgi:hypothetical protein